MDGTRSAPASLQVQTRSRGGRRGSDATTAERPAPRRILPTAVKLEVWRRDGGKCVLCGAVDDLHFDHDLPFSLGGTSVTAANVQMLCARHNLAKHDSIV